MMIRVATLSALVLLAACSQRDQEPLTEAETNTEAVAVADNVVVPPPPPPVIIATTERDSVPPPALDVPSETQVQADAEASGMTSRLPGDEETQPAANSSQ